MAICSNSSNCRFSLAFPYRPLSDTALTGERVVGCVVECFSLPSFFFPGRVNQKGASFVNTIGQE